MGKKRRRFDQAFKESAVRMALKGGHGFAQVAEDLGVRPDMIRRWAKQFESEGAKAFPGEGKARDEEMARLRRELRRVTEERDIMKKAVAS